jgi:hypothetical protein
MLCFECQDDWHKIEKLLLAEPEGAFFNKKRREDYSVSSAVFTSTLPR